MSPELFVIRKISIHALRVEGDVVNTCFTVIICDISIHALRVEGDKTYRASNVC